MKNSNTWSMLKKTLSSQGDLIARFNYHEDQLQQALINKNWVLTEQNLQELDSISIQINSEEKLRDNLFTKIRDENRLHKDVSFTRALALLPRDQREEFHSIYNGLRNMILLGVGVYVYMNTRKK